VRRSGPPGRAASLNSGERQVDSMTSEAGTTTLTARKLGRGILGAGPALALAIVCIAFGVVNPNFFAGGNLQALADQSAILLVVALGATFVIIAGSIDLSVPGVMAVASLVTALLAKNDRNDNDLGLLAVVAAIAVGALFGLVNGLLCARVKIPSFMVTLGVGAIGIGIATVLTAGRPPRLLDATLRGMSVRGDGISGLVVIALAALLVAFLIQRYTRVGRYGYAIGGDEPLALLSGIRVPRYKTSTFVLAGALSGLAGVMASLQLGVGNVGIGAGQEFAAITAVVIGGTALQGGNGNVLRTLVGVLLLTVLANGLILAGVDQFVQPAVQGVVIVAAVAIAGWSKRNRVQVVK
jgi:ribose transport system permease protein